MKLRPSYSPDVAQDNLTTHDRRLGRGVRIGRASASILLAPSTLSGCSAVEILTGPSDEEVASKNATSQFETLQMDDIMRCKSIGSPEVGPAVTYQGQDANSVNIPVELRPGDKYSDPYFRDKGSRTSSLTQEIVWTLPIMTSTHEIGNETLPGFAQLADSDGNIEGDAAKPPFLSFTDVDKPKRTFINVPLNPQYEGERVVTVEPFITEVSLKQYDTEGDELSNDIVRPELTDADFQDEGLPWRGAKSLSGRPCAKFSVEIRNGRIVNLSDLTDFVRSQ